MAVMTAKALESTLKLMKKYNVSYLKTVEVEVRMPPQAATTLHTPFTMPETAPAEIPPTDANWENILAQMEPAPQPENE